MKAYFYPRYKITPKFSKSRRYDLGFTLLEVLISFTLIALILTIMYSGLQMVHRSSSNGAYYLEKVTEMRSAQLFLRRQLTNMLPATIKKDEKNQANIVFYGAEHRMSFVANLPAYIQHGGPYINTFSLEEINGENALVFSFKPLHSPNPARVTLEPEMLVDGVKSLRFQYRGRDGQHKPAPWQDVWDKPEKIPSLIRISVESKEKDKLYWPDFIVAPIAAISVGS
jgi:general secretion pathway protein J